MMNVGTMLAMAVSMVKTLRSPCRCNYFIWIDWNLNLIWIISLEFHQEYLRFIEALFNRHQRIIATAHLSSQLSHGHVKSIINCLRTWLSVAPTGRFSYLVFDRFDAEFWDVWAFPWFSADLWCIAIFRSIPCELLHKAIAIRL